jgi:hypothetical protein
VGCGLWGPEMCHHSFLCNARETLSHATTLAFRFYILKIFGYSQDILKIFDIFKIFGSHRIKKPAWTFLPSSRK